MSSQLSPDRPLSPDSSRPEVMRKSYSEQYAPYPSTINANHGYPSEEREHRTIFGLRPATFWLSIALFVVILLAAGLGGGIGGTAVENKNNQLQAARATIARLQSGLPANPKGTGTVTVTTGAATVTVTATPTSDCLKHANENYTAPSGVSYEMLCGTDLDASTLAIYFTGVTPNFEDCIDLCDSYNAYAGVRNITSINYNPTGSDGQLPGTCWCTDAPPGYHIKNSNVRDSAYQVGTFNSGDLP